MDVTIKDILPLINTNDVRLLDSNGDEIALIYQGYNVDLLSDETLHRRVTGIWNDERILNTVNIQIAEEE